MKHLLNAGCAAIALTSLGLGATAVRSNSSMEAIIKQAEGDAAAAGQALTKHKPQAAVGLAEHAVQLRPQDATYRALLGKAYLAAGRFFSAKQAFADALQLDPGLPGVALNLALATTATGDFSTAQQILDANANRIGASDRGLAVALAGNPAGGVDILLAAARAPEADAKTRQNLALALALAGRWPDARQVALADLSPSETDARIVQWANFARPTNASDQVSALLGVTPVADGGVPVQLALVAAPVQVAEVASEPKPAAISEPPAPVATVAVTPAPVAKATPGAAPAVTAVAAAEAPKPAFGNVVFGARREVVQALPAAPAAKPEPVRVAKPEPVRVAKVAKEPVKAVKPVRSTVAAAPTAKGNFHVQIGAYSSASMAKWGWDRASKRYAALSGKVPTTMLIGSGLTRLSVGGMARNDAIHLCQSLRAKGGACFVRQNAGDQVASWWGKGRNVQLASR